MLSAVAANNFALGLQNGKQTCKGLIHFWKKNFKFNQVWQLGIENKYLVEWICMPKK